MKNKDLNINLKNHIGFTAFMLAVKYDTHFSVKLLLQHPNLDVNIQNNSGYTPLMYAVLSQDMNKICGILSHNYVNLNLKTSHGKNVFHLHKSKRGKFKNNVIDKHEKILKLLTNYHSTKRIKMN